VDIRDFTIGKEHIDDRFRIAVFDKFGIYLVVLSSVGSKE
jgi:hypothetical protein